MKEDDLKNRTKKFALRILKLIDALPNTVAGRTVAGQLARSGTSVAAIIVRLVGDAQKLSLLQNLGLSKKNRTKAHFGWK